MNAYTHSTARLQLNPYSVGGRDSTGKGSALTVTQEPRVQTEVRGGNFKSRPRIGDTTFPLCFIGQDESHDPTCGAIWEM